MEKEHYYWIDNIKIFACLLVLLGHFFQSMTKSGILPDNAIYQWFNQTIYYFRVPLFFVCSGFLYQKFSKVNTLVSWKNNVLKKAIALGVPYFTFSFITWLLKTVFAGSTNDAVGGLGESLFLQPISPYWFLYCLFFIFLITPTFKNVKTASIAVGVALLMRILKIIGGVRTIFNTNSSYKRDLVRTWNDTCFHSYQIIQEMGWCNSSCFIFGT